MPAGPSNSGALRHSQGPPLSSDRGRLPHMFLPSNKHTWNFGVRNALLIHSTLVYAHAPYVQSLCPACMLIHKNARKNDAALCNARRGI
jgi:hypothetical protein